MSEKITFKELVEKIANETQQSYNSTNDFIHELVGVVEGGLREHGSVSISGFGKFELRWMKERPGRNPQTGEEITIPGQNKVVFKPFKDLREQVNKPYSKMTAQVLNEPVPGKKSSPDTDEESLDDLIIERESPVTKKKNPFKESLKQEDYQRPIALVNEAELTEEVEKSSTMKWSYAAAALIVMLAIMTVIFLMQRTTTEQPAQQAITEQPTQQQPAQQPDEAENNDTAAPDEGTEPGAGTPLTDPEPETTAETAEELETTEHTINPGESLWTIAENQLGNPYLWPLIYYLNQDMLDNPNQLSTDSNIEIPSISDPENLTTFEQEQVALGYFSLYEWAQINNPDEARYFLWAVGVFSPDLLEQRASEVDSDDLAFASQR